MRRSIATVSLSGTLPEKLEAIAAARFDAVEIFENDLLCFNGSARDVRRMAADLGLEIALYQPFRDFEGVPPDLLRRNLDRAERKFDVMQELGAPLVLVCSNVSPQMLRDDALIAAQLHDLGERAGQRGLRIGYEALSWGAHVKTFGHVARLVEQAAHPHVGIILDSFHTLALGDDVAPIADLPWNRIFFVQLADAPRMTLDPLSWSRHFRCFPAQGDLDVAGFLAAVLEAGYAGPISLEIFNDDFRAAPPRQTAQDGMRSLLYLEEQVRARLPAPAAGPKRRQELFQPPEPPALQGISFVEFAVDDEAGEALGRLFRSLGFARAGRHRSKDVTLYRQGEINLVLNAERDSFAHSYFAVHGPAVCAIGLRAEDELGALNRAEAFHCARYEGRVGPNELEIPAVRSVDGSLLYFAPASPRALDTDFVIDETEPSMGEGAGLTVVDHLAQALPAGQLDSWILFYRSVLGLVPDDVFMLPDPYGLVRSRAVANREHTVRFPLNISQSRNTATARSVSTFAGAGMHHLAFATSDIFQAAAAMRDGGVPLLPIPANYYSDLAARFDLDERLLGRLQQAGILYDRNDAGEFFHVYTQTFEDRFFFEVVQRVGDYQAYGAVNAAVRLAAQAQLRAANEAGDYAL
jgi:4-hydroxyphenylpyruvate dioxygenase